MVNEEDAHRDMLLMVKAALQRVVYHRQIGRGKGMAWSCHKISYTA